MHIKISSRALALACVGWSCVFGIVEQHLVASVPFIRLASCDVDKGRRSTGRVVHGNAVAVMSTLFIHAAFTQIPSMCFLMWSSLCGTCDSSVVVPWCLHCDTSCVLLLTFSRVIVGLQGVIIYAPFIQCLILIRVSHLGGRSLPAAAL